MLRLHSRDGRAGTRRLGLGLATATVLLAVAAPAAKAAPFVYVTKSGNEVAQYDIGAGGLLAPLSPFTVAAGESPNSVAVSPDGNSVYVGNLGSQLDDVAPSVSQYDLAPDGTLSPKSPASVPINCEAVHVAVSPDGKSLYAANGPDCERVSQYDIGEGGTLSPKSPPFVEVGTDFQPLMVAVSPDSQSVYVTNTNRFGVSQFDVGADGKLSPKNPPTVAAGVNPLGVAVSPDGQSVYVTNNGYNIPSQGTVSQYNVGAGGKLSPKSPPTVAAGTAPRALAVSPDGRSAYVVNLDADSVSQYDIDPASGALSPKTPATVAAGDFPTGIAVNPDGQGVYVTNRLDDNVSQYDVGASGELSAKNPATVAVASPAAVAVSPLAPVPTAKNQCKHGGWKQFGFKNRGRCVAFVNHNR